MTDQPGWTDPASYYRMPDPRNRRRLDVLLAFFIPLLFILIHVALQTIVFIVYMVFNLKLLDLNAAVSLSEQIEQMTAFVYQHQSVPMIVSSLLSALLYALFMRAMERRRGPWLLRRRPRPVEWLSGTAIGLGTLGSAALVIGLIDLLGDRFSFWQIKLDEYIDLTSAMADQSPLLLQTIALVFAVPLAEELLFRGIVCGALRPVMSQRAVIILSAAIFAVVHWNLIQSAYVILAGLALGAAYMWSESIWLTIGMHMFFNFMGSILPQLLEPYPMVASILVLVEIVFVLIGLFFVRYLYKHRRSACPKLASDGTAGTGE